MSWAADVSQVDPKPGDLLEISAIFYHHWAVYIGDGNVVHLTRTRDGLLFGKAVVSEDPVWKVVGKAKCRINNKYDGRYTPFPVHEIISRAKAQVGRELDYNVFSENCEHFVTGLRYGIPVSDQVTDGIKLGGAVAAGIIGVAGIAAAVYLVHKVVERRCCDQ